MQYELKDTNWIGAPKVKATDPTKVTVKVIIKTGIVGDTYGFIRSNVVDMEFSISMTGTQMETETQTQAIAFVAATYPNT